MANNLNSRAMRVPLFSINPQAVRVGPSSLTGESSDADALKQLEGKIFIGSLSFRQKVGSFGLRTVLKSYVVRYRYMLGLWLLRESAIIAVLSANYEKITDVWSKIVAFRPISWLLVTLFKRLSARLLREDVSTKMSVIVRTDNNISS